MIRTFTQKDVVVDLIQLMQTLIGLKRDRIGFSGVLTALKKLSEKFISSFLAVKLNCLGTDPSKCIEDGVTQALVKLT